VGDSSRDEVRSFDPRRDVFSEGAFEDLYRDTFPIVWAIARRAARDDEEAADVAQKAYLAVFDYWSRGALREDPRHLLYRVAKRGAIDLLRARSRGLRLFARLPKATEARVDVVSGPLGRALRRLKPDDAALVMLQAAGGFSYEELARIERATVAAIRSRLHRARRALARHYEDEGGEW
jgi:RNA polymerase sigma-70 factor (ECF subfamily)